MHTCVVHLLDGTEYSVQLNTENTYGVSLFEKVCAHLQLWEKDYFSLRFIHPKDKLWSWLNFRKTLKKQLKEGPYSFYFAVKFFPPDPCRLQGDLTRYLFVLAIRDLVEQGRLTCTLHYQLLLASYIVQAEFGNFGDDLVAAHYLDGIIFVQNQGEGFTEKLIDYHKQAFDLEPEEAEIQYLKVAKVLPFYGVELHDVKDTEFQDLIVGVSFNGIQLYKDDKNIHTIYWQELISASFFKKGITIKVSTTSGSSKSLLYKCSSRGNTKRLYRSIVDFHTFFRRPIPLPPVAGASLKSKFRFNGQNTYLQVRNMLHPGGGAAISRTQSVSLNDDLRTQSQRVSGIVRQEEESSVIGDESFQGEYDATSVAVSFRELNESSFRNTSGMNRNTNFGTETAREFKSSAGASQSSTATFQHTSGAKKAKSHTNAINNVEDKNSATYSLVEYETQCVEMQFNDEGYVLRDSVVYPTELSARNRWLNLCDSQTQTVQLSDFI